ncbi:MAG: GTP-binding protein, partial [Candidatus Sulfotelmatobacter sp.]
MTQPTYNSTSTAATTAAGVPTLAIVGRPNVGKSTLFNRIVGSRRAIVGDEPGITRDRLYGDTEWRGRRIRIIDTGGIIPEDKNFIPSEIFRQARVAFDEAAAIVMVVDGRSALAGPDLELVRLLRKTGRPLFLAVNKADTEKQAHIVDEFHQLGIKQMFPISAEHGRGIDDLLDAVFEVFPPAEGSTAEVAEERKASGTNETDGTAVDVEPETVYETKVAIIGHPNV